MNKNIDENFLTRWLKDELTENELEDFKQTSDYFLYTKIMEVSSGFEEPDFAKEKVYENIESEVEQKSAQAAKPSKKSKVIALNWVYGAVAAVLLLLSVFYMNSGSEGIETKVGEQLALQLPDQSEVVLNANSSLSFDEDSWAEKRLLKLRGEAYFNVEKGATFTVETKLGKVQVLGTQFNVRSYNDYIEVQCFEGKVSVKTQNEENILTRGKALRVFPGAKAEFWDVIDQEPKWKKGETTFRSISLKYVVLAIENQYDIKIDVGGVDLKQKFTGSFTHANLKIALKTVFEPMKIGVIFTNSKTVTLVKQ